MMRCETLRRGTVSGRAREPERLRPQVMAAKYALAHKGILLEREKLHLASMGFSAEELVEVTHSVLNFASTTWRGDSRITRRSPTWSARWRA